MWNLNGPLSEVCLPCPEGFCLYLRIERRKEKICFQRSSVTSFLHPNFSGTMETNTPHLDGVFLIVLCYLTVHLPWIPQGEWNKVEKKKDVTASEMTCLWKREGGSCVISEALGQQTILCGTILFFSKMYSYPFHVTHAQPIGLPWRYLLVYLNALLAGSVSQPTSGRFHF